MSLFILLLMFVFQDSDFDLDLNEITELAAKVKSAEELERKLNTYDSENIFNNLDLDNDGFVDYISVEEVRSGNYQRGKVTYLLTIGENEIAKIEYEYPSEEKNQTQIIVIGHPIYYGDFAIYRHRAFYKFHPFWTKPYWNKKRYISPFRYISNTNRSYPNYWRKTRLINKTAFKKIRSKQNKRVSYHDKKKMTSSKKHKNQKPRKNKVKD